MKICLIKGLDNKFSIPYNSDFEVARKLKAGEEYFFEVKKERNIKFHRKLFALLNMVFDNQEHYNNIDHLRKDLTIASGYYETRITIDGEQVMEARSISFSKMDELEFGKFYNAMIDSVVKYFHFDKQSIIDNIEQYF